MTNPNYYHQHKQEDATVRAASYPIMVDAKASQSVSVEKSKAQSNSSPVQTTAPNSASSSPISFNNINMNRSSSNHNLRGTPVNHDYQQLEADHRSHHSSLHNNSNMSRGPLSPHSAPPTTSVSVSWNTASDSNTPVPSVIHTETGEDGDATMSRSKMYGSAPSFPSINRTSSGNISMGSVSSTSNLLAKKSSAKVTGKKKHQISKSKSGTSIAISQTSSSSNDNASGSVATTGQKKQRRLERNRLSAQLSRRRRKQYLEELEDRVVKLSLDMDSGRRSHAFSAIQRISEIRREVLASTEATVRAIEASYRNTMGDKKNESTAMLEYQLNNSLRLLENTGALSLTNSEELLILNSFLGQQLKSFSLPSHVKFILWLTLQDDIFYRGGRAASERLSAARIGERMLAGGKDKVTPADAMWPLVCNEVGLSYELEERLRIYQRTAVLQEKTTWVDRHTARSSGLVMQSMHDAVGGMAQMVGRRETRQTQGILSPVQRVKFLAWANKNSARIKGRLKARKEKTLQNKASDATRVDIGTYVDSNYELKKSNHLAANLYILNYQLQRILKEFPYDPPSSMTPTVLKKLMRRASFESLGQQKDTDSRTMSREDSFPSSASMKSLTSNGSLMKSQSHSTLGQSSGNASERPNFNQITPQVGEKAASELVDEAIGFVKPIIPPIPKPPVRKNSSSHLSGPTTGVSTEAQQTQAPSPVVSIDYRTYHRPSHPASSYQTNPPSVPGHQAQQYTKIAIPHHHHQSTVLQTRNYAVPHQPAHSSSHVQHGTQEYPLAPQPPMEHYYSSPQTVQYATGTTGGSHVQAVASVEHSSSVPTYETSSSTPISQQHLQVAKNGHVRKSSFLPPHLNVVPEDMFPGVEGTAADFFELQDCLMDGEDWGIGVGLDMDTTE